MGERGWEWGRRMGGAEAESTPEFCREHGAERRALCYPGAPGNTWLLLLSVCGRCERGEFVF